MEEAKKTPEVETKAPDPKDFFLQDRQEREKYAAAAKDEKVLLPLTRDGFEALLEITCNSFSPPLPIDDSTRKVFAGYVHHMINEEHSVTIEQIGKVLYKAVSNSLTWTIDQEIKAKAQQEHAARAAKVKAEQDAIALKAAEEKRAMRAGKKGAKRVTVTPKNEASQ